MNPIRFYSTAIIALVFTGTAIAEDADFDAAMERGAVAYALCGACHAPDGQGLDLGEDKMAPSLTGGLTMADPAVLALVILKGIAKEDDDYVGVMAPLGDAFNDQQLADVMTYVRNSFDNEEGVAYTDEQAAEFRAKWADVEGPVGSAKLEELTAEE